MRIDSTDATNFRVAAKTNSVADQNANVEAASNVKPANSGTSIKDENIANMSDYEKRELPVSERVLIEAVERANKAVSMAGRTFEYRIHEKTKEIMIKVIDSETKKVIREIPPEKTLDMVAKMMEMAGLLVDERR